MFRHLKRLLDSDPRVTATGAAAVLVLALVVPGPVAPVAALGWSPTVDAPSGYDAQQTCRTRPQPGTVALSRWLLRTYRATGSMGLIRACKRGGTSEHKDGRAFDWAADVRKPAARRAAYAFIRRALATDAAGNRNALARRMGIMYLIYNDTIWASYRDFQPRPYLNSACRTKRKCSRTLRHLNHVHISLGYAGAAAQTSWYRSRNVRSLPVLFPGTKDLDPDATAVSPVLTVPATGAVRASGFTLKAGVTYRFVATGTVRHGPVGSGQVGDAHCIATPDGWVPTDGLDVGLARTGRTADWPGGWGGHDQEGSDHEDSPAQLPVLTTHGLVLAGALRWGSECRADHTYEAWYTPPVRQRVVLGYVDAVRSDNAGTLSVYVARDDVRAASLARK